MSFDAQQALNEARGGNEHSLGPLLESYKPYLSLLARVQIGQRLRGLDTLSVHRLSGPRRARARALVSLAVHGERDPRLRLPVEPEPPA